MKYNYLAAWTRKIDLKNAVLDKIFMHQNAMYICLAKGAALAIVLSPQDSFIYYHNCIEVPKKTPELWLQLAGSSITNIAIKPDDRIIYIECRQKDIYGDVHNYELICELMPPKPNVILFNKDKGLIQDALYKYSLADNPMRMVLVNQPYYPPQTSFTPDTSQTLEIPKESTAKSINEYFATRHQQILLPNDQIKSTQQKIKILSKEIKRLKKKLDMQGMDLANALKMDYYKACAEAIKPNMHLIEPGDDTLEVTNYLDPHLAKISVPLLSDRSPQQNLHYYIKKYQKAKNGKSIIELNIKRTEAEIEAVKALQKRLEQGEDIDLDTHKNSGGIAHKQNQIDRILQLRINAGWHIYIGRKARENDFITTKLGKAHDWWFHSRIYRGAHVLLRNYHKQEPPPSLIQICCALAAWYSQAKFSINVPVDYTQIRFVRKPKGSAAGFVTYTNYKTIFANPKDIRSIKEELEL
ncbi:MAG: NFACT RNA binding domain-containing protein [Candidatus Cloacimonetes bacterium]|nr:NFACT RNA binding domain-containing protein [Candidatus Cloacimonadota bacterium]